MHRKAATAKKRVWSWETAVRAEIQMNVTAADGQQSHTVLVVAGWLGIWGWMFVGWGLLLLFLAAAARDRACERKYLLCHPPPSCMY